MKLTKQRNILIVTYVAYVFSLVGVYYGVDMYIDAKCTKLELKAKDALNAFFDKQSKYIGLAYNSYSFDYAEKEKTQSYNASTGKFEMGYGDMYDEYVKVFDLFVLPPNENKGGWALQIVEKKKTFEYTTGFLSYYKFPAEVGFKASWGTPDVRECVQNAFEFTTTNEKSDDFRFYEKRLTVEIIDRVSSLVNNRYYKIVKDSIRTNFLYEKSDNNFYFPSPSNLPVRAGGMQNHFYEVIYKVTQPTTYSIVLVENSINRDRYMIMGLLLFILTIIALPIIITTHSKIRQHKKKENETLYEMLLRRCTPANYFEPYNKDKVEAANLLFVELQQIEPTNVSALKGMRRKISERLEISFLDNEKLVEMKERCNPNNFMNPYNSEAVSLANELFAKLSEENLTVDDFEDVEQQVKKLYEKL